MQQDLGAAQGEGTGGLGKDPVEADHHADGGAAGLEHAEAQVAGGEDQLFIPEQMGLAVDLDRAVGSHQDAAVVKDVAVAFGQAGAECRVRRGGVVAQAGDGRSGNGPGDGFGQRHQLIAVAELVTCREEFGQHHEVGVGGHEGQGGVYVAVDFPEHRRGLDGGEAQTGHDDPFGVVRASSWSRVCSRSWPATMAARPAAPWTAAKSGSTR